ACARVRMNFGKKPASRSHDIRIGPGAARQISKWLKPGPSKRAFIVADEKLTEHRQTLRSALTKAGWEIHEFPVTAGEELKSWGSIQALYGKLLDAKADRNSTLFALGGGTVG